MIGCGRITMITLEIVLMIAATMSIAKMSKQFPDIRGFQNKLTGVQRNIVKKNKRK